MSIYVLIPAYEPDERLTALVRELLPAFKVVVVNDGSRPECGGIFRLAREEGATVLSHAVNLGKGAALKTGLRYLCECGDAEGVITADADGQHSAFDIRSMSDAMLQEPHTLFLGVRDFKRMPPRSRFGNTMTRFFFRLFTGTRVSDTQTGLRGLPACLFDELLMLSGERYEYEMNMLLALKHWDVSYREIPIETIYIDNNRASHFNALRDGWHVFSRVIKYAFSSLSSTALDYFVYWLLLYLLPVSWSYAAAKAVGALLNFELNCRLVFRGKPTVKNMLGYALLAGISMFLGSMCVKFLSVQGFNNFLAKIAVDLCFFFLNYFVQNRFIFKKAKKQPAESGVSEREP